MSEFLAEASVLVRANTEKFRTDLLAEVKSAVAAANKIAKVSITPVVTGGSAKKAAAETVAASQAITRGAGISRGSLEAEAAARRATTVTTEQSTAALADEGAAATATAAKLQLLSTRTMNIQLANRALATAAEKLTLAENTVAGSADRVAAASEASAAAQTAVSRAATSGTGAQKALAASALEAAAAFERQAIAAAKAAASGSAAQSRNIAAANVALANSAEKFAVAQGVVAGASSAAAEAQIVYNRAAAATAAAVEALDVATRQGTAGQQILARNALVAASAFEKEALAANEVATANERAAAAAGHHAVALKNVGRGSATAALSAVGLRGATLTANAGFIAGAAAAIGFGKAISTSLRFETSLNVFAATVGATGDQMAQVSEQAKQLGADITLPSVNAQDAADAMSELAKAGLSVEDSIAGARGVLQLATAAAIDNATATQIAASALNAFGLAGQDAVHVADVLANAANQSQGSIADVGLSLQQAAAVSRQVGVSFEDTVALLTLLARNGIRGSDAGTSLRVAFTKLINPSNKAKEILKQLNIQLRDVNGNIRPEVFSDFAQAQQGLSRTQQDTNAGIVFGTDALRAYSIAAREGTTGLNNVRDALQEQGSAAELAAARTKGLAGSMENLKNQLATLGLSIGQALNAPLKDFVDILAGGFQNINAGIEFLNRLAGEADKTGQSFAELAVQAGKINFAVQARGGAAGPGLLEEQQKLNKALEDSLGPGVNATKMIEGYRDALHNAASEAEGLRNRVDETANRFAKTPTPAVPQLPPAIGPTAKSERAIGLAQAGGDLAETARLQKIALDRAKKAFADSKGNIKQRTDLFEKVTQAEVALATTERQISDEAAQKTKQAADDAKTARAKADQAILDSFTGRQSRIDLASIKADNTATLKDNIAVQNLIISVGKQEIATIKKTVSDMKTRNTEIASRVKEIASARIERTRLIKEAADAASQKAQETRDLVTERLGKRLELAQLIGKRDPILAAFNALIANERKNLAAAKKANKLDALIALQQTIKDRNDFIKGIGQDAADGVKQATTAFDLLKEFADTFNQNAGNLINQNQPFAGPTGFTADIAQFLVRRPQQAQQPFPGKAKDDRLVASQSSLIDAINANTEAVNRASGNSTVGVSAGVNAVGQRGKAMGEFWKAKQARDAAEARSGV